MTDVEKNIEIINQMKSAIDGIFIDIIDNGLNVDRQLVCRGKDNLWLEVRVSNNRKSFRVQSLKDCSLTLTDYIDYLGKYKIRFVTLNSIGQKETFKKFPLFNFKEIRKFKILILIRGSL